MNELDNLKESLRARLKNVIVNTCNKIGCDNCSLKFNLDAKSGECSATDLERKIEILELN